MQANGTFISSRNLARRQDGMTSSASLQQWLYTRASHFCTLCMNQAGYNYMSKIGSVVFSLSYGPCAVPLGKSSQPCRFSPPQKGMYATVMSFQYLFSVLLFLFFPYKIHNIFFLFLWQLKSESIQSSQFQSKLNEVIRTLTQVRR